ncbi:MAG: hypothetical protein KKG12_06820, partial [Gammaproteobacteria bacterium]|nr:hypothetical protein [Gammaproteobacteria bacterium]
TRLQLRSSLASPTKKVFGKQRLTVLVHVSFPAPDMQGKLRLPFFLGDGDWLDVVLALPSSDKAGALRVRAARVTL